MPTSQEILEQFPFDQPRDGQVDAVSWILDRFNEGKKIVFLEAPCGAGKSVIGMTVAKFYSNSFYITATKILQDQLSKEFGENGKYSTDMIDLKGRGAYECTYYKKNADKLKQAKLISLKQYTEYQKYHPRA